MTISLGSRHVADNIVMHQNMGKTNFMNDAKNIDQKREEQSKIESKSKANFTNCVFILSDPSFYCF